MVTTSTITTVYLSMKIPTETVLPPRPNHGILKCCGFSSPAGDASTTAPATASKSMKDAVRETSQEYRNGTRADKMPEISGADNTTIEATTIQKSISTSGVTVPLGC